MRAYTFLVTLLLVALLICLTNGFNGLQPATCPAGSTKVLFTCVVDFDSYSNPSFVADCPTGYVNIGLWCASGADSYSAPSLVPDCTHGTNFGLFCLTAPWEDAGVMTCPANYFLSLFRCRQNCRETYTNMGETCYRPPKLTTDFSCPAGSFLGGLGDFKIGRCYPNCRAGYTSVGESCIKGGNIVPFNACPAGMVLDGIYCHEPCQCADGNTPTLGCCGNTGQRVCVVGSILSNCSSACHGSNVPSVFTCVEPCPFCNDGLTPLFGCCGQEGGRRCALDLPITDSNCQSECAPGLVPGWASCEKPRSLGADCGPAAPCGEGLMCFPFLQQCLATNKWYNKYFAPFVNALANITNEENENPNLFLRFFQGSDLAKAIAPPDHVYPTDSSDGITPTDVYASRPSSRRFEPALPFRVGIRGAVVIPWFMNFNGLPNFGGFGGIAIEAGFFMNADTPENLADPFYEKKGIYLQVCPYVSEAIPKGPDSMRPLVLEPWVKNAGAEAAQVGFTRSLCGAVGYSKQSRTRKSLRFHVGLEVDLTVLLKWPILIGAQTDFPVLNIDIPKDYSNVTVTPVDPIPQFVAACVGAQVRREVSLPVRGYQAVCLTYTFPIEDNRRHGKSDSNSSAVVQHERNQPCVVDGDCPTSSPFCYLGLCRPCVYSTKFACADPRQGCNQQHQCVNCTVDTWSVCNGNSYGSYCVTLDTGLLGCGCNIDAYCKAPVNKGPAVCNLNTRTCPFYCTSDSQCAQNRPLLPICSKELGYCIACHNASTCPLSLACGTGSCGSCALPGYQCTGQLTGAICTAQGNCGCLEDSHCDQSVHPKCNVATSQCRQCALDTECASSPHGPYCSADGRCSFGCSSDTDCEGSKHPGPHCVSGKCVQCSTTKDCPGRSVCQANHTCGSCSGSGDLRCVGNTIGNQCVAVAQSGYTCGCTTDLDCNTDLPICDTATFSCSKCATNDQCAAVGTNFSCNLETGRCAPPEANCTHGQCGTDLCVVDVVFATFKGCVEPPVCGAVFGNCPSDSSCTLLPTGAGEYICQANAKNASVQQALTCGPGFVETPAGCMSAQDVIPSPSRPAICSIDGFSNGGIGIGCFRTNLETSDPSVEPICTSGGVLQFGVCTSTNSSQMTTYLTCPDTNFHLCGVRCCRDCPSGFISTGDHCTRFGESRTDIYQCPSGYTLNQEQGRCYVICASDEFVNLGEFCVRKSSYVPVFCRGLSCGDHLKNGAGMECPPDYEKILIDYGYVCRAVPTTSAPTDAPRCKPRHRHDRRLLYPKKK